MNDLTLHTNFCDNYTRAAFTHDYIFAFTLDHMFYAVKMDNVDARTLVLFTTLDRAAKSKGGAVSLRFRPTNAIKRAIVEMGNVVYKCTAASFAALCESNKYNKGENAEKLVTEKVFGETWHKDSVPFTDGADVSHYQVKFQGATFCKETQLF